MELVQSSQFFAFMQERELIRLRKEAGEDPPYTQDPILSEYKFTNVRRYHDKTSTVLRELFYEPNYNADPKSILMNAALFRYFGTYQFAQVVGWQEYDTFDFKGIKKIAKDRLANKKRVFTGAYVITNQGISAPKQDVVVDYFLTDLHKEVPGLINKMQMTRSWRTVAYLMRSIKGFGGSGFMTKETLLDTMFCNFWNNEVNVDNKIRLTLPDDWNTWTPIGPGARRGVARICGVNDMQSSEARHYAKDKIALEVILKLQREEQERLWDEGKYGTLSPTDIQFQLCEFDKYERVRLGQGRPRSKYRILGKNV